MREEDDLGLYIHVPFCERVCPYCDFAVVAARPLTLADEERYVAALLRELELHAPALAGKRLASVYLGGGTPSLLSPRSIERLIGAAAAHFAAVPHAGSERALAAGPEITLEVNPSSLERERLPGFREAGVNRLSLGVQSFDDTVLRRLGRAHRGDEARRSIAAARRAGFANLSLDLIFAAPQQRLPELLADLDEMMEIGPEHISTYELIVEEGTPFELASRRGQLHLPSEASSAEMLEQISLRLEAAGFEHYELASFARPGHRAVHNSRYWRRRPVLGLGVGAHSSESSGAEAPFGRRRANLRGLADYLEKVEAGELPTAVVEPLSAETARGEAVFLGLRLREGLDARAFEREFGGAPRVFFDAEIGSLIASNLLEEGAGGDLRLSARGRLLADLVSQRFV